jgi:hypothetical protein
LAPRPPEIPKFTDRERASMIASEKPLDDDREMELDRQRIARQMAAEKSSGKEYDSIFDRFWFDDFSTVPVIGPAASNAATAFTKFYEGVGDEYSYAASGLLGSGLSREEARDISAGQLLDAKIRGLDVRKRQVRETAWGPTNINVLDEDFNVNWTSGLADTAVAWFLDPFVILGKASKIARVGTNFGRLGRAAEKVGGLERGTLAVRGLTSTRAQVSGPGLSRLVEREVDDALKGRKNRASILADEIVAGDFNSLRGLYEFRGSHRDMLASTASRITNKEDALRFLGAATGNQRFIRELQETRPVMFVEMLRSAAPSRYEEMAFAAGESRLPAFLDKPLEAGVDVDGLLAGMRGQSKELDDAIKEFDALYFERYDGIESTLSLVDGNFAPIERWGMNSAGAAAVANAWRRGKQKRGVKADPNRADDILDDTADLLPVEKTGTRPLMYERVFSLSSNLPKVRLWTWITGSRASGLIDTRGYEYGNSTTELTAVLSDSKTLRGDANFRAEMMNKWGEAAGASDRYGAVMDIELESFRHIYAKKMAAKNAKTQAALRKRHAKGKLSDEDLQEELAKYPTTFTADSIPGVETLDKVYAAISGRRAEAVTKVREGRAYLIDMSGDIIRTDPRMRSQLETKVPMLDFRVLEDSADILAKMSDGVFDTARTVAKGESKFARKNNAALAKGAMDTVLSLWKASVLMRLGYTQRNVAEGWLRSMAAIGIVPMLTRLPAWAVNAPGNAYKSIRRKTSSGRLAKKEEALIDQFVKQQRELSAYMKTRGADDVRVKEMTDAVEANIAEIERLRAKRQKLDRKRKVDSSRTVEGRKISAFDGEDEDVLRELTSMNQTTQQFLESSLMREQDLRLASSSYGKIMPGQPQYFEEVAQSVVQMQNDPVASRLLQAMASGRSGIDDVQKWARSSEGRFWRKDMRISNLKAVDARIIEMDELIRRYLPTLQARTLAASGKPPGGLAMKQAIEPYVDDLASLAPVHGREVTSLSRADGLGDLARKPLDFVFKWLGSVPETTLVRQPYYASVWAREFDSLLAIAQRQYKGKPIPEDVLNSINKTARTRALRNLKDTLYTVERLSNPAALFRWMVPFFPAWENSMKAWGRMIYNDPSIAARASILWNLPNQLGMVVDSEGRPVESDRMDFLTGSQEKYVRLPSGMNKWLMDNVTSGIPLAVPQGALNVVTPGETPFLPGFGPIVQIPVAQFLRAKPDTQEALRSQLPEQIYNQIAPFGVVPDVSDAFLPSGIRKMKQLVGGEDDRMFLGIADSMMKAEFVDWYADGANPATIPDVDEVMERTRNFYLFSITASFTAPFATTRTSKYQMQEDYWRQLMQDPSMTYREKTDMFVEKFGTAFLPMIESTTKKVSPTIGNTIESFNVIDNNKSLVSRITQQSGGDPRGIGVLTAGTQSGEFDAGVYKFWSMATVPGTGDSFSRRKTPEEMQTDALMSVAWREFRKEKELRDEALEMLDVSINSNAAKSIKARWDNFVKVEMRQKYGQTWTTQYDQYEDLTPTYLTAINSALYDDNFMSTQGREPLWRHVERYMEERQLAQDAIDQGAEPSRVRELFMAWAEDYKYSSLDFSDFYDNFLENDNLTTRLEALDG